jgi:hypothetical protein
MSSSKKVTQDRKIVILPTTTFFLRATNKWKIFKTEEHPIIGSVHRIINILSRQTNLSSPPRSLAKNQISETT